MTQNFKTIVWAQFMNLRSKKNSDPKTTKKWSKSTKNGQKGLTSSELGRNERNAGKAIVEEFDLGFPDFSPKKDQN